jgi:hypothetical protein
VTRLAIVALIALAGCTRYVDLTRGGDAGSNVTPDGNVGPDAPMPLPDAAVADAASHD